MGSRILASGGEIALGVLAPEAIPEEFAAAAFTGLVEREFGNKKTRLSRELILKKQKRRIEGQANRVFNLRPRKAPKKGFNSVRTSTLKKRTTGYRARLVSQQKQRQKRAKSKPGIVVRRRARSRSAAPRPNRRWSRGLFRKVYRKRYGSRVYKPRFKRKRRY